MPQDEKNLSDNESSSKWYKKSKMLDKKTVSQTKTY